MRTSTHWRNRLSSWRYRLRRWYVFTLHDALSRLESCPDFDPSLCDLDCRDCLNLGKPGCVEYGTSRYEFFLFRNLYEALESYVLLTQDDDFLRKFRAYVRVHRPFPYRKYLSVHPEWQEVYDDDIPF